MAPQLILSSCGISQSGMPNNDGPFPGTTRKLHLTSMPLFIFVILHMPICGIQELLYAYNTTFYPWIYLDQQFW